MQCPELNPCVLSTFSRTRPSRSPKPWWSHPHLPTPSCWRSDERWRGWLSPDDRTAWTSPDAWESILSASSLTSSAHLRPVPFQSRSTSLLTPWPSSEAGSLTSTSSRANRDTFCRFLLALRPPCGTPRVLRCSHCSLDSRRWLGYWKITERKWRNWINVH